MRHLEASQLEQRQWYRIQFRAQVPGQAQAIRRLEQQAIAAVIVVQRRDLGVSQPADQVPGIRVVAEQTLAGMHAGPAQAHARIVAVARPVEALPTFLLVEILVPVAVEDEGGLHHIAHRFALQLETQPHAAVGVEHIGEVAELVDGAEKRRVET